MKTRCMSVLLFGVLVACTSTPKGPAPSAGGPNSSTQLSQGTWKTAGRDKVHSWTLKLDRTQQQLCLQLTTQDDLPSSESCAPAGAVDSVVERAVLAATADYETGVTFVFGFARADVRKIQVDAGDSPPGFMSAQPLSGAGARFFVAQLPATRARLILTAEDSSGNTLLRTSRLNVTGPPANVPTSAS